MSPPQVATDGYRQTPVTTLFSLSGKTVVITGGARGLGLSFARAVAEVGANVAALDLLDEPHEDFGLLEKELGVKARFYSADVTDEIGLERTFEEVVREFGSVDCCITAAGIGVEKSFLEHTKGDVVSQLMVNVVGTYLTAQFAAKQMVKQGTGGSILLIASIAAHSACPGKTVSGYCASKGGVLSLCRALADELMPHNIRVNSLSPGYILTDMTVRDLDKRPNVVEEIRNNIPMGKLGDRRDLKGAVVLLLSDAQLIRRGLICWLMGG